jgi:transcriptional regulator GlxA family with amidase domain
MATMPNVPEFPPRTRRQQTRSRTVLFVAFEGMGLLDLSGSTTVFWSASSFMKQQGKLGYSLYAVSIDGGPIITEEGIGIVTVPVSDFARAAIDTIVVPGAINIEPALRDRRLVDWLRVTASKARRMASVCAGAFLLADAGLLHERRATTHWSSCALLGERYPSLKVEPDAIFVRDDPIWTSAGVSAGIDLSLAMVQDDCGHNVAMQVARQLVVYMKRPGGQSQFSELLQLQTTDSPVFDDLHLWMAKNLQDQRLTVDMLAKRVNMSPRNFARSYKTKTGRTPAKALELFRVEAARRLLEEAKLGIDQIARRCGFGDEERMRATFKRHLAISPRDYRRRFPILSSKSAKRHK